MNSKSPQVQADLYPIKICLVAQSSGGMFKEVQSKELLIYSRASLAHLIYHFPRSFKYLRASFL